MLISANTQWAVISLGLIFAEWEEEVLRTNGMITVTFFAAISVANAQCMAQGIFF